MERLKGPGLPILGPTKFYQIFQQSVLRQGVPLYLRVIGGKSGVSGRTRLLPGTPAHALVVLHNALPTGQTQMRDACQYLA